MCMCMCMCSAHAPHVLHLTPLTPTPYTSTPHTSHLSHLSHLSPSYIVQPLVISGLEDCLQFQRQTSMDASGLCPVPLSADPEAVVTDADKDVYLHRYLEHKLVRTIEAQADAFRQGVESVTGKAGLSLLSAAELKQLWGGHEVDDARLDLWRSRTRVAGVPPLLVGHFWEYLRQSKPSKRAQVLQL